MGTYNVWVVGPEPYSLIWDYDEANDIPGSFPGLTFDYFGDDEEPGPASYFAGLPNEEFPFALVHVTGQIVMEPHPGSEPDASVRVGVDAMREYLEANADTMVTPMRWHS